MGIIVRPHCTPMVSATKGCCPFFLGLVAPCKQKSRKLKFRGCHVRHTLTQQLAGAYYL